MFNTKTSGPLVDPVPQTSPIVASAYWSFAALMLALGAKDYEIGVAWGTSGYEDFIPFWSHPDYAVAAAREVLDNARVEIAAWERENGRAWTSKP